MFILNILIDAAILGIVIGVMERGSFPGWGPMIGCVFVVGITSNVVGMFLPGLLSLLGLVAGAFVGGLLLAWLLGTSVGRGARMAGTYLGIRLALSLTLYFMT